METESVHNVAATELPLENNADDCNCNDCKKTRRSYPSKRRSRRNGHLRRRPKFNFKRDMNLDGTKYDVITSVGYLSEKYGLRKSHYIEKFIKCIHRKINYDASKISDSFVESLDPWIKSKLFLLLVTLSERGGPDYWLDKNDQEIEDIDNEKEEQNKTTTNGNDLSETDGDNGNDVSEEKDTKNNSTENHEESSTKLEYIGNTNTLTELIIQKNINQDFKETTYDEDYVFSSIWANFMEGLINHYLEKVIVPHSEMKICQQLYKPMMKIISLYNEYNELMEKSEKNGFLPSPTESNPEEEKQSSIIDGKKDDIVTKERLARAQKLLWQARQDIPKTISKELTLLSEMYSTLIADEQDYELDEFVCCAEEYVELEFLPVLVDVLFNNCESNIFWKVLLVLEPFFYYIEDVSEFDDESVHISDGGEYNLGSTSEISKRTLKPDPRVITLEKICEVAARQKWI